MNSPLIDFGRLNTLFGRLYDENEGERNAAASAIFILLRNAKQHPADLQITPFGTSIFNDYETARNIYEAEIARLGNQLRFARQKLSASDIKTLDRIGPITPHSNRWPEMESLLIERIGQDGKLPHHWKKIVFSRTGLTAYSLRRWQENKEAIPDAVFEKIRAMTVVETMKAKDPSTSPPPKARTKSQEKEEVTPLTIQVLRIIEKHGPQSTRSLASYMPDCPDVKGAIYQRLRLCWDRRVPLTENIGGLKKIKCYDLNAAGRKILMEQQVPMQMEMEMPPKWRQTG